MDAMVNPEYQRLLRCDPDELRTRLPGTGPEAPAIRRLLAATGDGELLAVFRNLGGHDQRSLREAFDAIDDTRPTVIFAYTIKGYGLPIEGHPQNHSALLTADQVTRLADRLGARADAPWQRFADGTPQAALCAATARRLAREPLHREDPPADFGRTLGRPDGQSAYLRLSTRPVDQALAAVPADPAARERRRRHAVAGAYTLRRAAAGRPALTIAAMGALVPEAIEAATRIDALGFPADVVCVTSPDLLFRAVQARRGLDRTQAADWILGAVFAPERAAPMVTVLDGHPHTLAFLAGVNQVRAAHLGVTAFGQSGDLDSVYRYHHIDTGSILAAALDIVG
jgi:pyruvate dehydrogenase complex dehydrogenase (E1) component